jgi:beta-glucanase (GH16 family)
MAGSANSTSRYGMRRLRRRAWRILGAAGLFLSVVSFVVAPSSSAGSPVFHGSSSVLARSTLLTIALPEAAVPGDLMIASLSARTSTEHIDAPTGWKLLRRDISGDADAQMSQALYYRVAGRREPSSTTWSFSSSVNAVGAIVAYGGVNRRHPIETHAGVYSGNVSRFRAPSIRTSAPTTRILAFFGSTERNGITPPRLLKERFDLAGQDVQLEAASYVKGPTGATGAKWAEDSVGARASSSFGQLVALKSACSGSTGRPRVGQRPAIVREAYVGHRVTAYPGTWCGKRPVRLAYRWLRCASAKCIPIRGAISPAYTPRRRDLATRLTLRMTATNSAGTTTVKSSPARVGRSRPTSTSPPEISGAAVETFDLTASTGSWTGLQPMTYAYQWRRCDATGKACRSVAGATSATYRLGAADVRATLRVVVTSTNSAGSTATTSGASDVVSPAPPVPTPPSNTSPPTISGAPTEGASSTASSGSWLGTAPLTYTYQWQRCDSAGASCSPINATTATQYVPVSADVGSRLRVLVTASSIVGSSSAASTPTDVIEAAATPPLNTAPPSIADAAQVGELVSASTGTWTGTTPITFSYQWKRCEPDGSGCTPIAGATGASYAAVAADAGSTLRVVVTAVNAYGSNFATSGQCLIATAPTTTPTSGEPAPIAGQGYRLVFDDEFEGSALDQTKWKPAWYLADPGAQNYSVSNGILHLTSRRSEGYRSVELNSVHLPSGTPMHAWTYGYFEARAKWPVGKGNWSAFWLNDLGHQINWQPPYDCPNLWSELDIYENIWESPQTQWTTLHRNTNGRCGVPDETRPATTWMRCDTATVPCDLTDGFHTYAALWEPGRVRWYRDGQLIQSTRYHFTVADVPTFDSANQPMFLNLWLHSCDWSSRCTDSTTPDVLDHQFDYVRVWQKP